MGWWVFQEGKSLRSQPATSEGFQGHIMERMLNQHISLVVLLQLHASGSGPNPASQTWTKPFWEAGKGQINKSPALFLCCCFVLLQGSLMTQYICSATAETNTVSTASTHLSLLSADSHLPALLIHHACVHQASSTLHPNYLQIHPGKLHTLEVDSRRCGTACKNSVSRVENI